METIKAGKPAINLVRLCYAANLPVMFVGFHGIGKSELLQEAAAAMGIDFISRDLSLMEPPDLVGLPKMNGKTTIYLPPKFLPTSGSGILVFEELNRCEKYMRSPCLQLLTARMLNDYHLPRGWLPAAAINPPAGNYEVQDLNAAQLSRFMRVKLVPDQEEWLESAQGHGIHSAVIDYVKHDPSVFDKPDSNPRSWKYVSDSVFAYEKGRYDLSALRAAVVGTVSNERGAAFLRMLKDSVRPLDADAILGSYGQVRQQVCGWGKNGKLDMVKATLHAIKIHLQPKQDFEEVNADRKRWNNLARFLYDLPGDLLAEARAYFAEHNYAFPKRPRK